MAFSYPAVGLGGLTEEQWSKMHAAGDGIINDFDGTAWGIQIVSSNTVVRVGTANVTQYVRVNGYVLEQVGTVDLPIPPAVGTYFVTAQYDPARNVAGAPVAPATIGPAATEGPVRIILSPSTHDITGNKQYTMIARLARTVVNGAVTILNYGQRIGDIFSVDVMPPAKIANPETPYVGWDHPLGSTCFETTTHEVYIKRLAGEGGTYWQKQSRVGPFAFPAPASLVAQAADEPARYYLTNHRATVEFEGTLKRASGSSLTNGADVILGTMPEAFWPATQGRWSCAAKMPSRWNTVQVTIGTDGIVTLYDPAGFEIDWVDLSAISYRVRGR